MTTEHKQQQNTTTKEERDTTGDLNLASGWHNLQDKHKWAVAIVAAIVLILVLVNFPAIPILLFWIALYFLPTLIAAKRDHPYKTAILIIDVLAGWTLLGWIVALVWCFVDPPERSRAPDNTGTELEKFHELKEKGVITDEEFEAKKRSLLGE